MRKVVRIVLFGFLLAQTACTIPRQLEEYLKDRAISRMLDATFAEPGFQIKEEATTPSPVSTPSTHGHHSYSANVTQAEVERFFQFAEMLETVSARLRAAFKLPPKQNDTAPTNDELFSATFCAHWNREAPSSDHSSPSFFSGRTLLIILLIALVVCVPLAGWFYWKRKTGSNLQLVDLLPLVLNGQ